MSVVFCVFFFKQKTAYEMRISDWSSDVCSSDLGSPASIEAVAERGTNLLLDQLAAFEVIFERMRIFRAAVEARGRRYDAGEIGVARSLYVAKDADDRDAAGERREIGRAHV